MTTRFPQRTLATVTVGLLMGAWFVLNGSAAKAGLVTGLMIDDYSTSYPQREPSNTFNGTSTENSSNFADNWMTNSVGSGSIAWSLNGQYDLSSISVFNYRESGSAARSAKDVVLSVSDDYGKTFTVFSTTTLAQAPVTGTNTPTTFNLGGQPVTNVKLQINNSYADPSFVGLNEVEFFGTATHPTAQVPITVTAKSSEFTADGRVATHTVDGVYEANTGPQMWLSNGADNLPTITYSLGATPVVLDHLNIWNYNEVGNTNRGLDNIRIQLFDASMTSLGFATNAADGSTTFTLNPSNGKFYNPVLQTSDGNALMDTLGIAPYSPAASFFKIITLTNPDGSGFGGLSEVQAFQALPEPASLGLLAAGSVSLVRRRRRA